MTVVAGVDFGTQSVRVGIVDSGVGLIGFGTSEYPVIRDALNPDHATQSHSAHLTALIEATRQALASARIDGSAVSAMAVDTTGSSVVVVGEGLVPLDNYYLWCDHRAKEEAARLTEVAREEELPALARCGGVYSAEWGFAKLLHWLRHNPRRRDRVVAALEHCDLIAAELCGISEVDRVPRSICAMGHKWLWHADLGGFPPNDFFQKVDPLLSSVSGLLRGEYRTSDRLAGRLTSMWANRLGFRPKIPMPVGAFDSHWDAIGAGIAEGDVVNVIGTATCTMAIAKHVTEVPGVCGIVRGSIHPDYMGIEAGLSATGDLFEAISKRCGQSLECLVNGLEGYRGGQTGLLRFAWDNGDRTVLVNPNLGGITLGWHLSHSARDELYAAIEGTAFQTRIVFDRLAKHGVPVRRVIHAGGIPQRNELLNRVYANVLGVPVLVPERPTTTLGSAIFAFLASGTFPTIQAAQLAMCPSYRIVEPDAREQAVYERLYDLYRPLYFSLGTPKSDPVAIGRVLPELRALATEVIEREWQPLAGHSGVETEDSRPRIER